jgi:7,8-dihydropterin-6-yl-methyl-4-(beta-D-ribofuranosyl)aminobenzene 5'-phosphate synthase
MKLIQNIFFIMMLLSLGACSPASEVPTHSAPPTAILQMATTAPVATPLTQVPITENSKPPTQTSSPITATYIPEETKEFAMPVTQAITITIVYDNHLYDQRLGSAWGFSALVEYGDSTLLFDTGGDGQLLKQNMRILGIDPLKIESVVLSHIHDDHTGGLIALLDAGAKPVVYLLPSFPAAFKRQVEHYTKVSDVLPGQSLAEGIWTTGEIGGPIPEQALVIETEQGLVVITGCAHPGIVAMLEQIRDRFAEPIYLVLGGFHLGSKSEAEIDAIVNDFQRLEVKQAGPCHCTGDLAIAKFAAEYGEDFLSIGVGSVIRLETVTSK